MCGIAGYIGRRPIAGPQLEAALRMLRTRGPDHQARVRIEQGATTVDLLHGRLAIIDCEPRAHQPMTRAGCTLVYNGAIYNYCELRDELERRGARFTTRSDSEVLLAAYLEYGPACVEHFEGMWAFALYDRRARRLLLSRDRFGEKPLVLWEADDGLYFASTPNHLFALAGRRPPVNRRHVARFLVNGYKSLYKTDELFFEQVRELPPATNLEIDLRNRQRAMRYWTLPVEPRQMSLDDAVAGVRGRLIESVRLRLRADVPVALCLSGGVDSGALASIAARTLGRPITTFSIVDRDARYDESANIRATVADLGCASEQIEIPRAGALERLAALVDDRAAPVLTLSYYVHALLSEAIAARGCRVAISGTGADELLTGYYDHFNLHLYELRDAPELPHRLREWQHYVRPLVRNPHLRQADLYFRDPAFRDHVYLSRDAFAALLKVGPVEPFSERRYCDSLLRNRMVNELLHEVVPPILHEDDRNSMRCGIENRSPFLDRELVELACAIPAERLIRHGYAKFVLREAMRGVLNEQVRLDRRKVGFNAAFRSVIDTRDPDTRARLLDDGPIFELVDRARLEALLDSEPLPNSLSKFLFAFVTSRLFLERFTGNGVPPCRSQAPITCARPTRSTAAPTPAAMACATPKDT